MPSLDWDKLRIFHTVAEAGSLTRAGEQLNLSQSAVSRQISALEEDLQTPLFHRHARGLILTEQGEILFRTAHDMYGKVARVEGILKDDKNKPRGDLRITTTVGIGSTWLTPRLKEFIDIYPDINVELILDDRNLDLGMREADVGIRIIPSTQEDIIQRRLFIGGYHLYASHGYIREHGLPQCVEDLDNHKIILYGQNSPLPYDMMNWPERLGRKSKPWREAAFRVNSVYGILQAVENGIGLGALPDYLTHENTRVVRVLNEIETPSMETYLAYPAELKDSKRIGVFRDFLLRKVKEWKF
ncbi:MAG: LysR family transcriptional regulator [Alphaproteobacteria bacterium]|nr:MAG: LysR family transcriptional regulator [Alphaproteobacteria bacterium]